jgi:hypothetical protein
MEINLTDVLFQQRAKPRGDEAEGHINDLWDCNRKIWYRRNGAKKPPFTRQKLAQFALGRAYEMEVGATLADAGHHIEINKAVTHLGLVGHPDVIDHTLPAIIETKTTDKITPSDTVSTHHAIQASGYAHALGIRRAIVLVKYAGAWKGKFSHEEVAYEVNTRGYQAVIERRAAEILMLTGPGMPMPEPGPFDLADFDLCRYCDYAQCPSNPKHVAPSREELPAL